MLITLLYGKGKRLTLDRTAIQKQELSIAVFASGLRSTNISLYPYALLCMFNWNKIRCMCIPQHMDDPLKWFFCMEVQDNRLAIIQYKPDVWTCNGKLLECLRDMPKLRKGRFEKLASCRHICKQV
jgi:hypothetical protein